jgi:uncharacterized protein (TIGR00725 family)
MSPGKYELKPKIVVSGGAQTPHHDEMKHCGRRAFEMARRVGEEIIKQGAILATGATTGLPYQAALGAKKKKGFVVGLSPAISEREHIRKYKLPTDHHDIIIYTGAGYAGRNLLLTRVGDAVIVVCGHMGTLNEFTIAFEEKKPIGILEGPWETDDMIREVIGKARRGPGKITYSANPRELVRKVLQAIKAEKSRNHHYRRRKS